MSNRRSPQYQTLRNYPNEELEIKLYCVHYCLEKRQLNWTTENLFFIQDILLYLDLPCGFINNFHFQKDLGTMSPVYVLKTVHTYSCCCQHL